MAKSRKAGVVDSYAAIKAAQHADRARAAASPAEPTLDETGLPRTGVRGQPTDLKKLGAHVARTVVPAKQLIECYECGYKFQLHGRAAATNCSKCRATLDLTDHVIDGKWNESFKTVGTIRLTAGGVLESGDLVAGDFVLEGTIEAGTVRALRKLELRPGARFSQGGLIAPDLVIAAHAAIAFMEPAEFRNVEVLGTFRARLYASGAVTVRSGGLIEGELFAEHLIVEDGGGLRAALRIAPRSNL